MIELEREGLANFFFFLDGSFFFFFSLYIQKKIYFLEGTASKFNRV